MLAVTCAPSSALVTIPASPWRRETTISTLARIRTARTGGAEAQQALAQIIEALTPRRATPAAASRVSGAAGHRTA